MKKKVIKPDPTPLELDDIGAIYTTTHKDGSKLYRIHLNNGAAFKVEKEYWESIVKRLKEWLVK